MEDEEDLNGRREEFLMESEGDLNGRVCVVCGGKLTGSQRKYCGRSCADKAYYKENKEEVIKRVRDWQRRNPEKVREYNKKAVRKFREEKTERFNELMRRNYEENKVKWHRRSYVNSHRGEFFKILGDACSVCGDRAEYLTHDTWSDLPDTCDVTVREYSEYITPLCESCFYDKRGGG